MNKKILSLIGIGIFLMITISIILTLFGIVEGKTLDTIITITGVIIAIIIFFMYKSQNK